MKPDVLVMSAPAAPQLAQLEAAYTLHRYDKAEDKPAFLAEHGPKCEAIATSGHQLLSAEMLEHLPRLKIVSCVSAGYEYIDAAALKAHGAVLTTTSPALADDVADTAILLMLASLRKLVDAHAYTRSGDWARKGPFPLQTSATGKNLGIIGMGAIGRTIAARASAMRMNIAYHSRSPKPDVAHDYQPDLLALADWADVLIAILPGGDATRHIIDAKVLAALGPKGCFVNVARGSVVDEAALIAALKDGTIACAGLDVFASEPDPDPALTGLPNVTLLPHAGSATVETRNAMAQMVVDNLAAYFAGKPLISPVN
ncbi:2-hydroxyacid dehydrogenase [Frigidibacter sp. ROC022]|uniref:2-hydroxyacid dehydrogenase n=1 Tax=Frigidibacter sp. ROC022 TaxID=2971796 RepID=UPI00215B2326|nr:2-hydroxyacid dehydrogenase [Frigidibacter sp. ROC022]MCR8726173.1 2-hydroxyacid dehydrogenase [Frigidibacter sp. ROC022]